MTLDQRLTRIEEQLQAEGPEETIRIRVIRLPPDIEDVDDFIVKHPEAVERVVEVRPNIREISNLRPQ